MQAEEYLQAGQLKEAMSALEGEIRGKPAKAELRVFLFQLLSVMGQWERAITQLNVAAEMDSANLLMAQVCRAALQCEALRARVFSGMTTPLIFGEPAEWIGWLVQANQLVGQGREEAAQALREQAYEAAPAVSGTLNGEPFEWIADADSRLGPLLEGIVDGRYYWIPFNNIKEILIEAPSDLRDVVWLPAQFIWANEGQSVGLIPGRYSGSEQSEDDLIRLGRKTEWQERAGDLYVGLGQRVLATDASETPLMEVRQISLNTAPANSDTEASAEAPKGTDDG